jgi:hypothetical protein
MEGSLEWRFIDCLIRHCERSEAIQGRDKDSGLLRRFAPRNDGGDVGARNGGG